MIRVSREPGYIMNDGSTAAYSDDAYEPGTVIPVMHGSKEGTALVVRCHPILGGDRYVLVLDVDWTSFTRFSDGE